jgi:hypothetical protein
MGRPLRDSCNWTGGTRGREMERMKLSLAIPQAITS